MRKEIIKLHNFLYIFATFTKFICKFKCFRKEYCLKVNIVRKMLIYLLSCTISVEKYLLNLRFNISNEMKFEDWHTSSEE